MFSVLHVTTLFSLALSAWASALPQKPFEYCSPVERLEKVEFQVKLSMEPFSGYSSADIISTRASTLFGDFVAVSNGGVEAIKPYEETVFKETNWFLTQPDATPLEADSAIDVPYSETCCVRMREKTKLKHGEPDERKLSASLKICGIDLETFEQPNVEDIKESIDCDVYAHVHRATYKASVKNLESAVRFDEFGEVLKLFPFAGLVFHLDREIALPVRDSFVTHRFKWEEIMFHEVEIECSLDLRFRDEETAYAGFTPYAGEFSCSVDLGDVEVADKDVTVFIEYLRNIFVQFHLSSPWALSDYSFHQYF